MNYKINDICKQLDLTVHTVCHYCDSEKELEDLRIRIDCLTDKIEHFQDTIDHNGEDDGNPLNW